MLGGRREAAPVLLSPLGLPRDPKLCFPAQYMKQRPYEVIWFFWGFSAAVFLPHRLR